MKNIVKETISFLKKYILLIIIFFIIESVTMYITSFLSIETVKHLYIFSNANEDAWLEAIFGLIGVVISQTVVVCFYFIQRRFDRRDNLKFKRISEQDDELTRIDKLLVSVKPLIDNINDTVIEFNNVALSMITNEKPEFSVINNSKGLIINYSDKILKKRKIILPKLFSIVQEVEVSNVNNVSTLKEHIDNMYTFIQTMEAFPINIKSSFDRKNISFGEREQIISNDYNKIKSHVNREIKSYKEARKQVNSLKNNIK